MKIFEDERGRRWEVLAGRESWGRIFAIFLPRGDHGEVRQTLLDASGYDEANQELEALDADALRALLARSERKDTGG